MKPKQDIQKIAINTLVLEAEAIQNLIPAINEDFTNAIEAVLSTSGRVVITGVGKSAIIAQKIVATLNSTGTPSIFMHAADAIHGDLGILQRDDILIAVSKSGNTPEIEVLIPLIKRTPCKLIAIVGDVHSYLAKQADFVLNTHVIKEACPHNLAPTTSTTAQLAMGDALAICLLEARSFTGEDFARYHPGGSLGKRMYLTIGNLAQLNVKPHISSNANIKDVLVEITKNRLGAVAVIDDNKLVGIITDGDIRRMLEVGGDYASIIARDIMGKKPKMIEKDELAVNALDIMRSNSIGQIIVTDKGRYFGIVHLHDLLKEGII